MGMETRTAQELPVSRAHLAAVISVCFALSCAGVWVAITCNGMNPLSALPLGWFLVLAMTPLVAAGCLIKMFRVKFGSPWWFLPSSVLVLPQLYVCFVAWCCFLHYSGIWEHAPFW